MYELVDSEEVFQGDILKDFHFIVQGLGPPLALVRNGTEIQVSPLQELNNPYSEGKKENLIVNSFMSNAMIITQSCDIDRRDYINVCPVHPISNIRQRESLRGLTGNRIDNLIKDIRLQKVNYYFYLPQTQFENLLLEESYVDLQLFNSVPAENIKQYQKQVSLSDKGRHWLSYKLSTFLGRPF